MIQVEMIDDIRKTEKKVLGSFTLRQVICILLSLTYSVPIALLIPANIVIKFLIGFALALPVMLCGWVTVNNAPFEIVLMRYIYKHFLTPQKRKCRTANPYKKALKKVREEKKQEKINAMTIRQRKEYEKQLKKGKTITYSTNEEYKIYR